MNRQILHQQLHNRIENILERHLEMMQQEASIPAHELNDLLREIRISYELALSLHHHNALQSMEDLELAVASRYTGEQPAVAAIPVVPEITAPQTVQHVAATMEALTIDTVNQVETVKITVQETAHTSLSDLNHQFREPATIAGQFRESATLAATIASTGSSARIAESLKHQPIRDLRTAIGINERFVFIQYLFGNNPEQFSRTLDHLNNFNSMDQAKKYLELEVVPKFGWNLSEGAARNFMDLIERRYAA